MTLKCIKHKKFEVVFLGMERLAFAANKIYSALPSLVEW